MNIIDCTPPADLPAVVLVHSDTGFWLRVARADKIDTLTLVNKDTLPGARREAQSLGHEPAAWVSREGFVHKF
jgi:hypothetical protein